MSLTNGRVGRAEPGNHEEGEPEDLAPLLARLQARAEAADPCGPRPTARIAERLERRFGLGDRPQVARRLYQQVEKWVEDGGGDAYRVVSEIVAQAVSARRPGNYARATLARLLKPRRKEVDW